MKQIGTPGHGLKHIDAVTNQYGLRRRGDSRRLEAHPTGPGASWVNLWPIEGQQLAIKDLCAMFPHVTYTTMFDRLERGDRTLDLLGRPLRCLTQRQIDSWVKLQRRRRAAIQIRKEKDAYYARLRAGHAKL